MKHPDITLQLNEILPHSTEKEAKPQSTVRTLEKNNDCPISTNNA